MKKVALRMSGRSTLLAPPPLETTGYGFFPILACEVLACSGWCVREWKFELLLLLSFEREWCDAWSLLGFLAEDGVVLDLELADC